jgi:hypothetical protein
MFIQQYFIYPFQGNASSKKAHENQPLKHSLILDCMGHSICMTATLPPHPMPKKA